ncbi:hypothetical protein [Streptomyces sp. NPDC090025]|uniref:hypothetical protein n=1 Tax=Streptomyces sp. NPDC090025 TaxID=3365922 RepID=UPI00383243FD
MRNPRRTTRLLAVLTAAAFLIGAAAQFAKMSTNDLHATTVTAMNKAELVGA